MENFKLKNTSLKKRFKLFFIDFVPALKKCVTAHTGRWKHLLQLNADVAYL